MRFLAILILLVLAQFLFANTSHSQDSSKKIIIPVQGRLVGITMTVQDDNGKLHNIQANSGASLGGVRVGENVIVQTVGGKAFMTFFEKRPEPQEPQPDYPTVLYSADGRVLLKYDGAPLCECGKEYNRSNNYQKNFDYPRVNPCRSCDYLLK